jgi:hypothetical protein
LRRYLTTPERKTIRRRPKVKGTPPRPRRRTKGPATSTPPRAKGAKGTPRPNGTNKPSTTNNKAKRPKGEPSATKKVKGTDAWINKRIAALDEQGHAVSRHGEGVTEAQLVERALTGKRPDIPNDRPKNKFPRHATKFASNKALVRAEDAIRRSPEFRNAKSEETQGIGTVKHVTIPLERALGQDYLKHVTGRSRRGSETNPNGTVPTNLRGGTANATYRLDRNGHWITDRVFPKPPKGWRPE